MSIKFDNADIFNVFYNNAEVSVYADNQKIFPLGPNPADDPIVTSNLKFHYDYSQPACYPGTGTTVTDLVTLKTGSFTNGSFNTTGSANNIGYVSFTAGYLPTNVPWTDLVTASNQNYTVEIWVQRGAFGYSPFHNILMGNSWTSSIAPNDGRWSWAQYEDEPDTADILYSRSSDGQSAYFTNIESYIPINQWHQLVITADYSGNTGILYIDGVTIQSTPFYRDMYDAQGTLWVPGTFSSADARFTGDIAIARIYDKILTSTEVSDNWNAQKYRFGYT